MQGAGDIRAENLGFGVGRSSMGLRFTCKSVV